MTHRLLAATCVAALCTFAAGSAGAATTINFSGYQFGLNPGETLVTDFDSPLTTAPGFTLSGPGSLLTGTTDAGAAPATSLTTWDTTQYLSVLGGDYEVLATPQISEISFYLGSADTYNKFTFTHPGGATEVFTGVDLAAAVSEGDDGNRDALDTNGRYTFNFSAPIDSVRLDSSENSLEVSNIGAVMPVPEPTSWALMIMGFGGVGALLRVRRRLGIPFAMPV
ncbi:MAG: PEPxxWA-CTERM sorting domain-containing protein [Alphaproteobacteria bacterium]|nr:PEPxxWA-CTERM sorting domain-containing protein [Alphaproteobacteria bacterium]MBU1515964.1 PEPxxWA-CTERM sorting domain-containing protein [Alphaproteobacteria bacterium]MBU2092821.1 PEPxxWA-CTERM sorting domain-containing protein [Alphaproteobacteria bacterium]MBU2153654.1 PEPxxWA-CTERM sorting domain-containing protein [Alphaproteobacteria bacterium]MBU2308282.1 PEPxxWA-CTERM sorting domain-containing protein [Alphaproteobacteria bacterium]